MIYFRADSRNMEGLHQGISDSELKNFLEYACEKLTKDVARLMNEKLVLEYKNDQLEKSIEKPSVAVDAADDDPMKAMKEENSRLKQELAVMKASNSKHLETVSLIFIYICLLIRRFLDFILGKAT